MQYYSTEEKDAVRDHFDRPLLEMMRLVKNGPLSYFGLPGEKTLDLDSWRDLLGSVTAVEVFEDKYRNLKQRLDIYYSDMRPRTIYGDIDQVILKNGGHNPSTAGRGSWQRVMTEYNAEAELYYWNFDVVNLDYFGKLLPSDRGSIAVKRREMALRHLFAPDREDSWHKWSLMVTVSSNHYRSADKALIRDHLVATARNSPENREVINFLLESGLDPKEEVARLVHGTMASIISVAASNASVSVRPRGTILYQGAGGAPMLHLSYSIEPGGVLAAPQDILALLRAPLLKPSNPSNWPWFELLSNRPPGQTKVDIRSALDFLDESQVKAIISSSA